MKRWFEVKLFDHQFNIPNVTIFISIITTIGMYGCFDAANKPAYHKQKHSSYPEGYPFESGVPLDHKPRITITDDLYEAESLDGGILHKMPKLTQYEEPKYPKLPLEAGIQGIVVLDVLLDEGGNVMITSVFESEVSQVMEKAALESANSFKFKPAERAGKGIACKIKIPVHFWLY